MTLNLFQKCKVDALIFFVQELTHQMHEAVHHSEVIWYDSVTCNGDLKWQDQLNKLNRLVLKSVVYEIYY